ncbi:MAG: hypothetical protein II812_04150 [Prevotella sp.]|nr:hypothetical protein [Prevotella sp.]
MKVSQSKYINRILLWLLVLGITGMGPTTLISCSNDDHLPDEEKGEEAVQVKARVYETIRYNRDKTTAYNFEYPSVDPYGKPVMLSGTITVGDEVDDTHPGKGLLLYNHFTINRNDECPSKGELGLQKLVTGSGLITISTDYYGFGITEDKHQAYCIAGVNAQASVDALLAAKELLPTLGYSWNDQLLFNLGYSQGAQTAMGVVRLIDQKYPHLHITYTYAGGGPYDIPETYRHLIEKDDTDMPSTIISVLLAYNEYYELGIPLEKMFKEPYLSNIDEWILSKKYSSSQIDAKIGKASISDILTQELLDLNSDLSKKIMAALEDDNLCKGWNPQTNNHIFLLHNTKDLSVPVENTKNLYQFLLDQGLPKENISYNVSNMGSIYGSAHETGAAMFALMSISKICDILDIKVWFSILDVVNKL